MYDYGAIYDHKKIKAYNQENQSQSNGQADGKYRCLNNSSTDKILTSDWQNQDQDDWSNISPWFKSQSETRNSYILEFYIHSLIFVCLKILCFMTLFMPAVYLYSI